MRKRLKNKRRSCKLCKPHKTGWEVRWKAKDLAALKQFEKYKIEQEKHNDLQAMEPMVRHHYR